MGGGAGNTDEGRMESTEEEQLEVQEGETNVENAKSKKVASKEERVLETNTTTGFGLFLTLTCCLSFWSLRFPPCL